VAINVSAFENELGTVNTEVEQYMSVGSEFVNLAVKAGYTEQEAQGFIIAKGEPLRSRLDGPNMERTDMLKHHKVPRGTRRMRLELIFRRLMAEYDLSAQSRDRLLLVVGAVYHYKTLPPSDSEITVQSK